MTYIPDKEAFGVSKQLAQEELTTVASSAYSPPATTETLIPIGGIVIANRSNAARWFSMWIDDDGTGMTSAELVVNEKDIASDDIWTNPFEIRMNDSTGNISFQAEINSALTLTINGIETDLS